MGFINLLSHVLNFLAPAVWIALLLPLVARWLWKKSPAAPSWRRQSAINLAVAVAVLLLGLLVFGRDGKMLTYTAVALLCATSQWLMLRGWRR